MNTYSPKNEIKLMMLYLLNNVSFPLNHENLSNFFLDKYTTYLKFQEILSELVDNKLIEEMKTKTSVCYKATEDGIEALNSFASDITANHKDELDEYIKANKIKIKEEAIINANYTDSTASNFKVSLEINENKDQNFKIEVDVPSQEIAITMCENWKDKAKSIYNHIIKQLL